ncbi:YjcZ family sporulation protein [bacterium LRH843]|nr:YjcZ family sporulation protein [bacterium LRH843]
MGFFGRPNYGYSGYGNCGYGYGPGAGSHCGGNSFALIVVLFILLIIIGASLSQC